MGCACLLSLVLLFFVGSTFSNYYPSGYTPAASRYGSYQRTFYPSRTTYSSSYGSPKSSAYRRTPYSAVATNPLCKAGGIILLRVYVEEVGEPNTDPNGSTGSTSSTMSYNSDYNSNTALGRPAENATISYVDHDLTGTVKTDEHGLASIPVYGCCAGLIVYHKNGNPVYKTVDLLSCTTREEKVVIKVDDKCNFNLHIAHRGYGPGDHGFGSPISGGGPVESNCEKCGDEHQLVDFIHKSKDHTGYETSVAKVDCITVGDDGDNLKVMLKSQYGNIFNVLDITLTDSRSAVMALPPKLPADKKYDIVGISNTFEYKADILNILMYWLVFAESSSSIYPGSGTFTDTNSFGVEAGKMANDRWMLAVRFHTSKDPAFPLLPALPDPAYNVDLEGNVVVIDGMGNYQTVEHIDADNTEDYFEGAWFLVGCFCNNVPSMKVGDFFPLGEYTITSIIAYADYCKTICDDNPPPMW